MSPYERGEDVDDAAILEPYLDEDELDTYRRVRHAAEEETLDDLSEAIGPEFVDKMAACRELLQEQRKQVELYNEETVEGMEAVRNLEERLNTYINALRA